MMSLSPLLLHALPHAPQQFIIMLLPGYSFALPARHCNLLPVAACHQLLHVLHTPRDAIKEIDAGRLQGVSWLPSRCCCSLRHAQATAEVEASQLQPQTLRREIPAILG